MKRSEERIYSRKLAVILLLIFVMLVPQVAQAASPDLSAEAVYQAMMAKQAEYPEGMTWTNDNYYGWNGGIYSGGYGCAGFAFALSDAAFGNLPARILNEKTFDAIRPGDILRVSNDTHSVIVLQKFEDYVIVAEGNYNSSIHWGRKFLKTKLETETRTEQDSLYHIITRYPTDPIEHNYVEQSRNGNEVTLLCIDCGLTMTVTMPESITPYFTANPNGMYSTKATIDMGVDETLYYWWYSKSQYDDKAIEAEISNGDVATFSNGLTKAQGSMGSFTAKGNGSATLTIRSVYDNNRVLATKEIVVGGVRSLTGTIVVDGELKYGNTLTASVTGTNNTGTLSYQWQRKDYDHVIGTGPSYVLKEADVGGIIQCVVKSSVETGFIFLELADTVQKADGPAAPAGIIGIAPSVLGAEDGKLQGVSTAMEYADNESFTNSISCTGAEVTGLKAGTYYVRVAETATAKAGAAAVVTVPEGEEAAVSAAADIDGVATNLEGKVGLIFYVVMPDYVLADSGAYATLSINGTEEKQLVANAPHSPKGELDRHAFSYYATSTQLREKITLNLYLSDGTRVPMTRKGEAVPETGFEYSVSEYCDLAIAGSTNPAMVKLAKQVKAYGTAAQVYFNRNAEGLVVDDAVKAVTADDLQAYAEVTSGELPEGLVAAKPQGAVLILDEVTTLRVNWKFEQGVDPELFSYQIDGVEATLKHVGNDYFLEVANITSKQLGDAREFTISRDGKSYTWKGSALTWALAAVQKGGDNAKNVGKALFLYNQAAKEYFK